jgi:peptide-methionine (S)-S-oxide reductase
LEPLRAFFRAEAYHQKYRLRMEGPLARRLAALFEDDEAFVASTLAARMNGYLAGYGTKEELEAACRDDGLPLSVLEEIGGLLAPFVVPKDGVP